MPARLVQVTIVNNSDYPIVWLDDGRDHGFWQEPWYPSNIKRLEKGQQSSFRLESGGVMTGVKGWALFKIDVPLATNVGSRSEFFRLDFERAYFETERFSPGIVPTLKDPRTNDAPHAGPTLSLVRSVGSGDIANMDSSPFEFIPAIPGAPLNAPLFLANETFAKHVWWVVEVRNTTEATTIQPLKVPQKSIVYAITPRVEATLPDRIGGHAKPASGGDLLWFRHDGRLDGSFQWGGPEKVGVRWDTLSRVFSGGDGVIYGVTPRVEAALPDRYGEHAKPASGGDLMWYRHVGRNDGTFEWQGPTRVGIRWDVFKHVFSGGQGIIYGVHDNGDLVWYRHIGREDGSFIWEGPRTVGFGWSRMSHVFADDDGIIYGITPRVEAILSDHIEGQRTPPSGGDLMWYRHLGREDGSFNWIGPKKVGARWDGLSNVFSDAHGIIYGITPQVEAILPDHIGGHMTPASGGNLMWYQHLGRDDGSFKWAAQKKVGTGWSGLMHVFSGGVLPA